MSLGLGFSLPALAGVGGFSPLSLYTQGEAGLWIDPSDLTDAKIASGLTGAAFLAAYPTTALYQDSAGNTPVYAMEQVVGLALDKHSGLVLGTESVSNPGGPFTATTGWTITAAAGTITLVGSELELAGTGTGQLVSTPITTVVGTTYRLAATGRLGTYVGSYQIGFSNTNSGTPALPATITTTASTFVENYFTATATTTYVILRFPTVAAGTAYFQSISVRAIPGNHHIQPSTIKKPVISARKNLLLATEDFSSASWLKTAGVTTVNANAIAPDGTLTAATVTITAGASTKVLYQAITSTSGRNLNTWVKGVVGETIVHYVNATGTGAGSQIITFTGVWQQVTTIESGTNAFCGMGRISTETASVFNIWHPQLETGSVATTYQRVTTVNDYDYVGFPRYLKFDGVDDCLYSAATMNYSGTDKVTIVAGLTKSSDAVIGVVSEHSVDLNSNNGAFSLGHSYLSNNFNFYSKGTTAAGALSTVYIAPTTKVLTTVGDISAPLSKIRINGVNDVSVTTSQGTGNFGTYVHYIGMRGNATIPFNGNLFGLIERGSLSSSAEIVSTETWMNGKTGAY